MHEVLLRAGPLDALAGLLPERQATRIDAAAQRAAEALAGRTIWNISTTESGGGVAEMLHTLPGYLIAAGMDVRWLVLDGDAEFFEMTKRLHNAIHGVGDPCSFGPEAHRTYQRTLRRNLRELLGHHVRSGDLVLLHDPQSAGLLGPLQEAGTRVAWRSHIGRDAPNEQSTAGWEFLRRYVDGADALVFSRHEHAPAWIPGERLWIIPPSIDPLSPKNRHIAPGERRRVLMRARLLDDGEPGSQRGEITRTAAAPLGDARLVVQVSRWDGLKDMAGVMSGFARADLPADVHLVLAGPAVDGVTDDPEQAAVFDDALAQWSTLPEHLRDRVCLATIPMDDPHENATIVNALQRQAEVVVQKSMAEGFGLTVAEAMWKGKAVLASSVGGIQDQITHERDGLLVDDPADLDAFAGALRRLVTDGLLAHRLGRAARRRVLGHYLDDRQFVQTADLFTAVLGRSA